MNSTDTMPVGRTARNRASRFLSRTGWLSTLTNRCRTLVLSRCRPVCFAAGQTIYTQGDTPDGLFGFVDGGIKVLRAGEDGALVQLHLTEAGFWTGETALFHGQTRFFTLVATQPTLGLHLSQDDLTDLLHCNPDRVPEIYSLSHRNQATTLRLMAHLMTPNYERRIALRLLHYDDMSQDPDRWIKLGQEDLARLLSVSMPTLHRTLRSFKRTGLVELGYGRLRVRDRSALLATCAKDRDPAA
ncbi:CRP-like cAMP-binding protein [Aliiruegeria haliotis]|uniref:CRP-like cAMP-binding protein n=1 Tax=Aliiruegeria haliotis TaxID=1280846 RepID=A0A2T0RRG0_9RHOB|nr:Crp/Fnr family transcriptional regulator [Aliiruegeria haliotis]PRY23690.1 CRP-like cAMP-binding protein [Aliiruegeria haliotis]